MYLITHIAIWPYVGIMIETLIVDVAAFTGYGEQLLQQDDAAKRSDDRMRVMMQRDPTRAVSALLWRHCAQQSANLLAASQDSDTKPAPFLGPRVVDAASLLPSSHDVLHSRLLAPSPQTASQCIVVGRTPEGRPWFPGAPHADISVSHSGRVMCYTTANNFQRVGVDVEEVFSCQRSSNDSAASDHRCCCCGGDRELQDFIERRTRRLLPNLLLAEVQWLLRFDERNAALRFSAVAMPPSIASLLADEFFTSLKQTKCRASRSSPCRWLQVQRRLYLLWTMKEAFTKATGHGIPFGMSRIAFDITSSAAVLDDVVNSVAFHCGSGVPVSHCTHRALAKCGVHIDGNIQSCWSVTVFSWSGSVEDKVASLGCVGALLAAPSDSRYLLDSVKATPVRDVCTQADAVPNVYFLAPS